MKKVATRLRSKQTNVLRIPKLGMSLLINVFKDLHLI